MSKALRIGLFDSGLGGLSVLRHLKVAIPNADYLYVADSAYAPYGARSSEWISERSIQIARFLEQQNIDALLIACNTATAHAAEAIRAQTKVPVVAMEPAIKPATSISHTGKIAVLATEGTLNSERFRRLKDDLDAGQQYYERACHHWVEAVEANETDEQKQAVVAAEVQPLLDQHVDTFVLACTHFPFLGQQLKRTLPASAHLIDPAPAVVRQIQRVLHKHENTLSETSSVKVFTSGDPQRLKSIASTLVTFPLDVHHLPELPPN